MIIKKQYLWLIVTLILSFWLFTTNLFVFDTAYASEVSCEYTAEDLLGMEIDGEVY